MTVYTELSVIRSNLKTIKSKLDPLNKKEDKTEEKSEKKEVKSSDSVKNNNIEKEFLTYNANGTIERIALENKHLIDILG